MFSPSESSTAYGRFQSGNHASPAYNRHVRGPPIHVTCDCGNERDLRYGEKWKCEQCGKTWNTEQIPAEEYRGLMRDLRRLRLVALAVALCAVAIVLPLAYFVNLGFLFIGPVFLTLAAILIGPFWKSRVRRVVAERPRWELHPE